MISVVVPVYNAACYLARTVASVQAQTLPDWELLLVDDGSKDNSVAVAEDLCRHDSRIRTFSQSNAGAAVARNLGLSEARADYPYALCLDSDDLLTPDALQTLRRLLEAHPEASAACGSLHDIDAEDRVIPGQVRLETLTSRRGVEGSRLVRRGPDAPLVFGDLCFRNHIITPGQVLIRKSALKIVNGFEPGLVYVEDYDLWWRLTMQAGPIAVTPEVVLLYRHHGSSLSSNKKGPKRGATDFRWRLITYPKMSPQQKRTARIGYLYHCRLGVEVGVHCVRHGELRSGLKHTALGVRDLLCFFRDLVWARRQAAPTPFAPR